MTGRPDGTALWGRGTNEVADEREGSPPSVSAQKNLLRGSEAAPLTHQPRTFHALTKHLKGSNRVKAEGSGLCPDECVASEPDVFSLIHFCDVLRRINANFPLRAAIT